MLSEECILSLLPLHPPPKPHMRVHKPQPNTRTRRFFTPRAWRQVEGSKSMRLWRVPDVLIIQLKRFTHHLRFGIGLPEKLQDLVRLGCCMLRASPSLP